MYGRGIRPTVIPSLQRSDAFVEFTGLRLITTVIKEEKRWDRGKDQSHESVIVAPVAQKHSGLRLRPLAAHKMAVFSAT